MKRGFEENAAVDEGVNANGIRTVLHFEGDTLTVQRTYDAEPHLRFARAMREAQEGQRWGDMKHVARIPMAEYARFLLIQDPEEQERAVRAWLREHTQFVTFAKYLKK